MLTPNSALYLCFFLSGLFTLTNAGGRKCCELTMAGLSRCTAPKVCLTPPPIFSRPVMVVLGVGTQNLTCATASGSIVTSVANGAKATLYDVSCLASSNPGSALAYLPKLSMLTWIASVPALDGASKVPTSLGYPEVGHHYFSPNAQTPVFEVRKGSAKLKFVGKRLEGIAAPPDAMSMSADWLKLGIADGKLGEASKGIKFVYRVHIAGGKPAADICNGHKIGDEVTVPYATLYWLVD